MPTTDRRVSPSCSGQQANTLPDRLERQKTSGNGPGHEAQGLHQCTRCTAAEMSSVLRVRLLQHWPGEAGSLQALGWYASCHVYRPLARMCLVRTFRRWGEAAERHRKELSARLQRQHEVSICRAFGTHPDSMLNALSMAKQ